ncbi:LysM peptidoglycan-binding domain-containing protein [Planococcus sp. CAU13]|uniref:LysM peptidoglycan-binding domain-containing protein n=1 Tax=Planococcus sp. CAU13 TaxID=1541197 RepID=UPI00052FF9A0|nr:LysM peptidoglycan-binding domain-containing protein [Planococcus sp. CAU13]
MDKKNYRESLEKDRQEIRADNGTNLSRRAQRQSGNQPPEKRRNLLLPVLFFIFILIPVAILIFVAFIYEPDDTEIGMKNDNEVSVENISPPEENTVIVPEETEEDVSDETGQGDDSQPEESGSNAEQPEVEVEDAAPEEPAESATPAPQETPATPETPAAAPETPAGNDSGSAKTVVVQENETLYRIAVNNYGASGAGAAVEKIKQANGLSSNDIYVGQTLILP